MCPRMDSIKGALILRARFEDLDTDETPPLRGPEEGAIPLFHWISLPPPAAAPGEDPV